MRSILKALPLLSLALTHPIGKSAVEKRALSDSDTSVLQLALYLEHLEFALYTGGHDNFTDAQYTAAGFPAGFRDNVGLIAEVRVLKSIVQEYLMSSHATKAKTPIHDPMSIKYTPQANSIDLIAREHPCNAPQ